MPTPFGRRRVTYADFTASGRGVGLVEDYLRKVLELYANTHTEDDLHRQRHHRAAAPGRAHHQAAPARRPAVPAHRGRQRGHRRGAPAAADPGDLPAPGRQGRLPQAPRGVLRGAGRGGPRRGRPAGRPPRGPPRAPAGQPPGGVRRPLRAPLQRGLLAGMLRRGGGDRAGRRRAARPGRPVEPSSPGRSTAGGARSAPSRRPPTCPACSPRCTRWPASCTATARWPSSTSPPWPPTARSTCAATGRATSTASTSPRTSSSAGPGSSGLLVIHEGIYRRDLPPTVGAGGTVDYVSSDEQAYSADAEAREKPGTPGILQIMRAALALELKERLGVRAHRRPGAGADRPGLRQAGRLRAHRDHGQPRPRAAHRHLLLQHPGGRLLAAPALRHRAAQRPVRHPEPGGLLLRRAVRAPGAAHRQRAVAGVPRPAGLRAGRTEAGLGAGQLPFPDDRRGVRLHPGGRSASSAATAATSCPSTASTCTPAPGGTAPSALPPVRFGLEKRWKGRNGGRAPGGPSRASAAPSCTANTCRRRCGIGEELKKGFDEAAACGPPSRT